MLLVASPANAACASALNPQALSINTIVRLNNRRKEVQKVLDNLKHRRAIAPTSPSANSAELSELVPVVRAATRVLYD